MERWIVFKAKEGENLDELRDWCETYVDSDNITTCVKSSDGYGVAVKTKKDVTGRERIVFEATSTNKSEKQRAASKRQIMQLYEEKEDLISELNAIKRKIKELDMEDLFFERSDVESFPVPKKNPTQSISKVRCEGDGKFPQNKTKTIENAHGSSNVLVVRFDQTNMLIASGGVDFCVRVFSSKTKVQLSSVKLNAPVLAMDWCPITVNQKRLLAVSCMDGSLHLLTYEIETNKLILTCSSRKHHDKYVDITLESNFNHVTFFSVLVMSLVSHAKHSKINTRNVQSNITNTLLTLEHRYVVAIKWNAQGTFLATASHDHTALLFSFNSKVEGKKEWNDIFTRVQRFCLESAVEDVVFVTRSNDKKESLVLAERSSVYLHIVDLISFDIKDMNVNERDDTHLSFSILSVVPSPDGSMFCLATDSDQLVVLDSNSGNQICSLVGHKCGQYAQPSVCWDPSGDYIYSNSQKDPGIYIWSLATQRVVKCLSGHTKQVRSIDIRMSDRVLISGSFDKSISLWE